MTELDWILMGFILVQQVFWSYQQHRLIDKVMSGSYYAYQQAQGINDQVPAKVSEIEVPEDLRGVRGIYPF